MTPERHQHIKRLFLAAIELAPGEVEAFLTQACGADSELRREVESLLSNHRQETLLEAGEPVDTAGPSTTSDADLPRRSASPDAGGFRPAGTMIAGRYRLIAPLGQGGMAVVYGADDIELEQTVALKFLHPKLRDQPSALDAVRQEVRVARKIAHPNIVRIFDLQSSEDANFITMELVAGEDLGSLVRRVGPLPPAKVQQLARQLAAGLAAAHDAGILHRDLKPANVMIDDAGNARILDFGIAATLDDERSLRRLAGTPGFLAPELLAGDRPSRRSDLYAWGLVVYYAATAKMPSRALLDDNKSETDVLYLSQLPDDVIRCVVSCLQIEPERRPASAQNVLSTLLGRDLLEPALAAGWLPSSGAFAGPGDGKSWGRLADALFAAGLILLTLITLLADRTLFLSRCGIVKSPDALREIAEQWLLESGHQEPFRAVMTGITIDIDCLRHVRGLPDSYAAWRRVSSGEIPAVYFWVRQGDPRLPRPSWIDESDRPEQVAPGSALVRLDGRGRLLSLEDRETSGGRQTADAAVDWQRWFERSGLNWSEFQETVPQRWPPLFAEKVHHWERRVAEPSPAIVSVQAAVRDGRLVYWEVVQPWQSARGAPSYTRPLWPWSHFHALKTAFWLVAIGVAAWVAFRHVQQGQAHWRGAWRVAAWVMLLVAMHWLCGSRHSQNISEELAAAANWLMVIVFSGAVGGLAYLAIEPSARQGWPWSLVTLQHLLDGRLSDRGIWADALVGVVVGLAAVLARQLGTLMNQFLGVPVSGLNEFDPSQNLLDHFGLRYKFAVLVNALLMAVLESFLLLALVIALKRVVRSTRIAAAILVVFAAAISIMGRDLASPIDWLIRTLLWTTAAGLLLRFGLVASVAALTAYYALNNAPLTLDGSAWYAPTGWLVVALLLSALIVSWQRARPGDSIASDHAGIATQRGREV